MQKISDASTENTIKKVAITKGIERQEYIYIYIGNVGEVMRNIAVLKNCSEKERNLILSSIEGDDNVLFFQNESEFLESEKLENIDIIFGEPEHSTIQSIKNLRWIQMSWAGANKYTSHPELFENIVLTNAAGAYGGAVSEYVISGLLALIRKIFLYGEQIKNGCWDKIAGDDTLEGKSVLILGTGNIGKETAKKLKCFGCYVIGICQTMRGKYDCFDEVYTVDNMDACLKTADVVVIALPGTKETENMFDENRISKMKKDAILVNVGRGMIVNTEDLTNALQNGIIRGAVLDVTEPEPLPENHPLVYMENVILTPHISGITWGENMHTRRRIVDIFCENLKRDKNNEMKKNVIDFGKGY